MGESAFYCANHRVSRKCQQPPGWKIHRIFRWKMPFAVFRSGSGVSDFWTTLWVMDVRTKNHGRPRQKVPFPAAPVVGETF